MQLAASEQVSRILAIESVVRRSADSVEKFEAKGWRELSSLDCHCPADCRPSLERRASHPLVRYGKPSHSTRAAGPQRGAGCAGQTNHGRRDPSSLTALPERRDGQIYTMSTVTGRNRCIPYTSYAGCHPAEPHLLVPWLAGWRMGQILAYALPRPKLPFPSPQTTLHRYDGF